MFGKEQLLSFIVSIPALLLAITVHECAHGWAAYFMGDHTARYNGRLSLNPLRHLDPIGALCMLFFRFGWAKPVPINPMYFRNRRAGIITVSLAGPVSNFILGLISCILLYVFSYFMPANSVLTSFVLSILLQSVYMNTGLMIFNLIPIPPLDGSKILLEFLPYRLQYKVYQYERYFSLILILLVYAGTITPVLSVLQMYVLRFYEFVSAFIVNIFI